MEFQQAVKTCFSKYATFAGRAMRSEYWWFALFGLLVNIALSIVDAVIFGFETDNLSLFSSIFSLAIFLPSLAVAARRLHDTDRSAWWLLIGLIPLIGMIVLIVWFVQKGTAGPNRFGAPPLAAELADARL